MYFSFVTLTMLSYGDVVPLSGFARSLSVQGSDHGATLPGRDGGPHRQLYPSETSASGYWSGGLESVKGHIPSTQLY